MRAAASAIGSGLARAAGLPRLAALLWLLKLVLAAAAALPGWVALRSAIGLLPNADPLREALSFGVLADLGEMQPGLFRGIALPALGLAGLGLLAGLAAAAGALQVLLDGRPGRVAERFGGGALRFFGPFLRLGLLAAPVAGAAAALAALPLLLARRAGEWPFALQAGLRLGTLVLLAAVALLAAAVVDAGRIALVRGEASRARSALARGLGRVRRRPLRWLAVRLAFALLAAAWLALYALVEWRLPGSGPVWFAGLLLAQAVVLVQSGLRVALLGAEVALWDAQRPAVPQTSLASETAAAQPPEPPASPEPATLESPAEPELPVGVAAADGVGGDDAGDDPNRSR